MSKNDITGDRLVSKTATDAYRDNFDSIFKKVPLGPQLILKPRTGCQEGKCGHDSDCAVHNEPAYPAGSCDCSKKECK